MVNDHISFSIFPLSDGSGNFGVCLFWEPREEQIAVYTGGDVKEGQRVSQRLWNATCDVARHLDMDEDIMINLAKNQGWDIW